jgi:ankyrin repeat protein
MQLLGAGADIRAKNKDGLTAQEIAAEYDNKDVWNSVVEELGLNLDGTMMRKPLSEVCGRPGTYRLLSRWHLPLYRFYNPKRISLYILYIWYDSETKPTQLVQV